MHTFSLLSIAGGPSHNRLGDAVLATLIIITNARRYRGRYV